MMTPRPPGRPTHRRKPLKRRLLAHGIRYAEVARMAGRSYRAVQKHVDGETHSIVIQAAIEKLAPYSIVIKAAKLAP